MKVIQLVSRTDHWCCMWGNNDAPCDELVIDAPKPPESLWHAAEYFHNHCRTRAAITAKEYR